jgi:DNA-binding beta-propeller fold protein YncE
MTTKQFAALAVSFALWLGVAPPTDAAERLVFSRFIGGNLVTAGIDPTTGLLTAIDPARQFDIPTGLAVDSRGVVYVTDPFNNRVQKFDGSTVTSLTSFCCITIRDATTGAVIATLNPILNNPRGVAVDPRNDDVWIANSGASEVIKVNKNGVLLAVVGSHGQADGQFESPVGVAVDPAGNLFVADDAGFQLHRDDPNWVFPAANFRIQKFTSTGTFVLKWGSFCSFFFDPATGTLTVSTYCNTSAPGAVAVGDGQFWVVGKVGVDSLGNVYVSDPFLNRVQKFNNNGAFILKWGSGGSGNGQFSFPLGVAVDFADNVYVADTSNDRIQKFNSSGTFLSTVGSAGTGLGVFMGPTNVATLPKALVQECQLLGLFDPTILGQCQQLLVSEAFNKRVQVLDARPDTDNDSILDEIDLDPTSVSSEASNGDTGLTVVSLGGPSTNVYAPAPGPGPLVSTTVLPDTIRVTTETGIGSDVFGLHCRTNSVGTMRLVGGNGVEFHCSTPTINVLTGPIDWAFTAADGTVAMATLNDADSLSVDPTTSTIRSNAGTLALLVGGTNIALAPNQSFFADGTAPTTNAAASPASNQNGWNNGNVTVMLTATDNPGGSGVKDISVSLSGAQGGAGTTSGNVATVPVSANGVTTLTYFARDNAGNQEAAKTLTVRVDKSGPTITGLPGAGCTLWPPNHRLVQVATVTAESSVSGIVAGSLSVSATSNEPAAGLGSGNTGPDVVINGGLVFLRAERSALGTGRLYTIAATVTDLAGNVVNATASCSVPHDRR